MEETGQKSSASYEEEMEREKETARDQKDSEFCEDGEDPMTKDQPDDSGVCAEEEADSEEEADDLHRLASDEEEAAFADDSEEERPDPAFYAEHGIRLMDRVDDCKRDKARLQGELKQCEKSCVAMDKQIADNVAVTLKKRKEEIVASFDDRISICQDQIRDCKAERSNARADAVAARIQKENAPLEHMNTELEQQIEQIYAESNVKGFCRSHFTIVLFFPRRIVDWLTDAAVAVAALFLIPLLIIAGTGTHPFVAAGIMFLYLAVIFGAYQYILHHYMIVNRHIHIRAEELRSSIKENSKKMNDIAANIRKSQDETGYNLGIYDSRIAAAEGQMKEILASRKAALDEFENTTRVTITNEITAASQEERDALTREQQGKQQELDEVSEQLDQLEAELKADYEDRLGKDWIQRQRLNAFGDFCRENPELPLEQAIDCFRSTKR